MKTLKMLSREAKQLSVYARKTMPRELSKAWLANTQDAFLREVDSETGAKWADRYGMVRGEMGGGQKFGNVETALMYKKLQRTGRLLRGIRVKPFGSYSGSGLRLGVEMSNSTPYAINHELGIPDAAGKTVRGASVAPGVKSVYFGGEIHQRRHMAPSMKVLGVPHKLLGAKMRSFGW